MDTKLNTLEEKAKVLEERALIHALTISQIMRSKLPEEMKTAMILIGNEKAKRNILKNYKDYIEPLIKKFLESQKSKEEPK